MVCAPYSEVCATAKGMITSSIFSNTGEVLWGLSALWLTPLRALCQLGGWNKIGYFSHGNRDEVNHTIVRPQAPFVLVAHVR